LNNNDRENLERLHRACTDALAKLLEEGKEMCRVLSQVTVHPVSSSQRLAIMEQRVKENAAQGAYDAARQELFKVAGWGR
jgi:hypothetical protein